MERLLKIKPMFNRIVTTMNCYEEDHTEGGVIVKTKGALKEYQTVVAVGDTVKSIKEGDVVCINPTRYTIMKHNEGSLKNGVIADNMVVGYNFNTVLIGGTPHLMLYDQDIDFIVVEYESVPESHIILEEKSKILI